MSRCVSIDGASQSSHTTPAHRRALRAASGPASLEEAMWRFAEGDDIEFANVYRLAAPRIYGMFLRLCREPSLAEDLMHDTFVRIHRARRAYRRGADVLPWAYTIGRRLFVDGLRHRRRETSLSDTVDQRPDQRAATADDEITAQRMAEAVSRTLERLPRRQAEAFRLIREEGLSLAEAAERLGESNMALRLRTHRATQALREVLEREWDLPTRSRGPRRGPARAQARRPQARAQA